MVSYVVTRWWEPDDDPWTEHASHARGKCHYVNLCKEPHELTMMDVLGVPSSSRCEQSAL